MMISRNGLHLFPHQTTPAVMTDLLSRLLVGRRTHFDTGEEHVRGTPLDEAYWQTKFRKPNVGLATAMALYAESVGQQLTITVSPQIAQPQLAWMQDTLPALHQALARYVQEHDVGMLIAPTEPLRLWLLAQLMWLHRAQRFVLLARSRREALAVREHLREGYYITCAVHLPGVSPLQRGDAPPPVTVTTFDGAADIDFATADFAILLAADDVAREDTLQALEQVDARFRLYGLAGPSEHLPPRLADLRMAVFGPSRFEIDEQQNIRRDVRLLRLRLPLQSPSDRLRDLIWQNRRRNDFISDQASCLALGQPFAGRAGKQIAHWPGYRPDTPLAVVVLVQTVDHAVRLGQRLQGWPIYGAQHVSRHGLPRRQRHWLDGPRPGEISGSGCIALPSGLSDLLRAGRVPDVVVHAAGGASSRLIPDECLYAPPELSRPLLIIDLHDVAHSTAAAWSRHRLADLAARDIHDYRYDAAAGRTLAWLGIRMRRSARHNTSTSVHGRTTRIIPSGRSSGILAPRNGRMPQPGMSANRMSTRHQPRSRSSGSDNPKISCSRFESCRAAAATPPGPMASP